MCKYIINGKFLQERMQGIVRYALELIIAMDKIVDNSLEIILVIPEKSHYIPDLNNIKQVKYGRNNGIMWEQLDLKKYLKKHKDYECINLCNTTIIGGKPGITVVHDIMYKTFPENYKTIRNRLSRLWHCVQYEYIMRHEKRIITVSYFSKDVIELNYPMTKGKIDVVPNGWQHVNNFIPNEEWRNKYPYLEKNNFFFSLATLAKNKNGKWIIEIAKKNPDYLFAMGGKIYEEDLQTIPSNVKLLGFISDEDACALMKNCRAFLFPSLYEGFGIPPLEALAQGAEVISSDRTSMPEILGKSVHYIDPLDYDVDIEKLLSEKVEPRNNVLERYGWDKSARLFLSILRNNKE